MIYDDNRDRDQQDVTEMLDGMFWAKEKIPHFLSIWGIMVLVDVAKCDRTAAK
jgi:hypothetical protein